MNDAMFSELLNTISEFRKLAKENSTVIKRNSSFYINSFSSIFSRLSQIFKFSSVSLFRIHKNKSINIFSWPIDHKTKTLAKTTIQALQVTAEGLGDERSNTYHDISFNDQHIYFISHHNGHKAWRHIFKFEFSDNSKPQPRLDLMKNYLDHLNDLLFVFENNTIPRFTNREIEVIKWVILGKTNSQISKQLSITARTVKFHVSNIYRKLEVNNRIELVNRAHQLELTAAQNYSVVIGQRNNQEINNKEGQQSKT